MRVAAVFAVLAVALVVAGAVGEALPRSAALEEVPAGAAAEYVARVEALYNRTLALVEARNVSLPDGLAARLEEAGGLLAQAREALAAGDYVLAVRLATRAAAALAPVAAYLWEQAPAEAREEAARRSVEAAIEARERVLERVQALVARLNASGAPVPPVVKEKLARAERLLEEARQALEAGDLGVARAKLERIDAVLASALKTLYNAENAYLHRVAAAAAAARGIVVALNRTVADVERAVALVEEGRTREAAALLAGVEGRLEALARALDRIAASASRHGAPDDVVAALEEAANHTRAAAAHAAQAREALEANDTDTALLALNATIAELDAALRALEDAGVPSIVEDMVHQAMRAREAVAWALAKHLEKTYARISVEVDKTLAKLRMVKAKLKAGRITPEEARQAFQQALEKLERIRELLPPTAPAWLKAKLDKAIEWIQENMP